MYVEHGAEESARVLLVDDNKIYVALIESVIDGLPLQLMHVAKDGVEAMAFLKSRAADARFPHPDLILLDINMPRKGGFEVLKELKNDPRLCGIPVVMFTSNDSQDDIDRAYAEGASSFVVKPVDLGGMEAILTELANYWVRTVRLP